MFQANAHTPRSISCSVTMLKCSYYRRSLVDQLECGSWWAVELMNVVFVFFHSFSFYHSFFHSLCWEWYEFARGLFLLCKSFFLHVCGPNQWHHGINTTKRCRLTSCSLYCCGCVWQDRLLWSVWLEPSQAYRYWSYTNSQWDWRDDYSPRNRSAGHSFAQGRLYLASEGLWYIKFIRLSLRSPSVCLLMYFWVFWCCWLSLRKYLWPVKYPAVKVFLGNFHGTWFNLKRQCIISRMYILAAHAWVKGHGSLVM